MEEIRKFFRFEWKGKLYEWQVLPFRLKCSPRILTKMVKSILAFLRGKGFSLSGFMDDFINQAGCRCKMIFEINVIALVFMCCGWSINWGKTVLEPTQIPLHLGFLWDTVQGTIVLPEEKTYRLVDWTSKILQAMYTTQGELESLVGTMISVTPAVGSLPYTIGLFSDHCCHR